MIWTVPVQDGEGMAQPQYARIEQYLIMMLFCLHLQIDVFPPSTLDVQFNDLNDAQNFEARKEALKVTSTSLS